MTVLFLVFAAFPIEAGPTNLEMTSAKNDDHFEVTNPLFFWQSSPGRKAMSFMLMAVITWKKLGSVVEGTKNGAVICDPNGLPIQINGKYTMFVGDSSFGICHSNDLIKWSLVSEADLKLPPKRVKPFERCVSIANYSVAKPKDIVLFIAGTLNGKGSGSTSFPKFYFLKLI